MSPPRRTSRRTLRSTVRELARLTVRTRWRAPDDLGAALAAFARAVRAHRRLARLAPRFFDSAVVDRERREREAQRLWIAECELALAKVYGTDPQPPPKPGADLPPLPSPRTQRAIEYQLTFLEFWLALGHQLLKRHFRRHPHALPTHSRITRILELVQKHWGRVSTFGQLSPALMRSPIHGVSPKQTRGRTVFFFV